MAHAVGLGVEVRAVAAIAPHLQRHPLGDRDAVRLMTNNPGKIDGLTAHGVDIVDRVPLQVGRNRRNGAYLDTKAHRMGHLFDVLREPTED